MTPFGNVAALPGTVLGRAITFKRYGTGSWRSSRFQAVAVHAEPGEAALIDALRRGDERAFARLVDRHHPSLLRVARLYVRDRGVAEEVVQETWLAVLEGIDRFEARSSLKTWIYQILTNRAKTRARREHRQLPFSALSDEEPEVNEGAIPSDRRSQAPATVDGTAACVAQRAAPRSRNRRATPHRTRATTASTANHRRTARYRRVEL
jgi:RNA polymerase sigma factor (sigma-70 family)